MSAVDRHSSDRLVRMTFLAGVIVGAVVGFAAATALARSRLRPGSPGPDARQALTISIASVALVVAAVALARSDHHGNAAAVPPVVATTTTSTTAPAPATSTTPTTSVAGTVTVPNVVAQAKSSAVSTLQQLGLRVSVDTLALANVPPGFVISQTPLPLSEAAPGTTVVLEVSAAA